MPRTGWTMCAAPPRPLAPPSGAAPGDSPFSSLKSIGKKKKKKKEEEEEKAIEVTLETDLEGGNPFAEYGESFD